MGKSWVIMHQTDKEHEEHDPLSAMVINRYVCVSDVSFREGRSLQVPLVQSQLCLRCVGRPSVVCLSQLLRRISTSTLYFIAVTIGVMSPIGHK